MFRRHASEISLIISDSDLPRINGVELCRRVKDAHPTFPMIVTSGFVDADKTKALAEIGVKDILEKPYDVEELLLRIRQLLDGHTDTAGD